MDNKENNNDNKDLNILDFVKEYEKEKINEGENSKSNDEVVDNFFDEEEIDDLPKDDVENLSEEDNLELGNINDMENFLTVEDDEEVEEITATTTDTSINTNTFSTADFTTLDAEVLLEKNETEEVEQDDKVEKPKKHKKVKKIKQPNSNTDTYAEDIKLADKEFVIKEYNCIRVLNPYKQGKVILTNKRLLCTGNENAETEIENISSIKSKYYAGFDYVKSMWCFLFVILTVMFSIFIKKGLASNSVVKIFKSQIHFFPAIWYVGAIICGIVAIMLMFYVYRKEFILQINTKPFSNLVYYKGYQGSNKENGYRILPSKDANIIVKELGAYILNIKNGKFD